jgi:PUA domain protein
MAPGVVRIDGDFKKDDFLLIIDERHGKSLGIGTALFDSQTMNSLNHGRIVKNHHFVGDKIWDLIRKVV